MLEDLWDAVIDFLTTIVVPDWGALVALIPIALAGLVALFLVWTVWRFATAGPTRRGVRRLPPVAPPGVHMPGPSFAPILGALGAFLLLFGLLAGGIALWLGIAALGATLLYWGREAVRDYQHIPDVAASGETALMLPPAAARQPPPGVHMPPPSFRPILVSLAMALLVLGLVTGGWILVVGVVAIVATGLGWLRDARREYVDAERADLTGHLESSGGNPPWPTGTLALLGLLMAVAVVLSSGVLPIGGEDATGGEAPAASGQQPGAPGEATGGAPGEAPSQGPEADVRISAENIAFLESAASAPADTPFTIAFDNRENVPHNVAIRDSSGAEVFTGEVFNGPAVEVYDVPALPAGAYTFVCSVHPNMTGTLTVG